MSRGFLRPKGLSHRCSLRPVESNRNTIVQGLHNVLTDECSFLPTVDAAIDFLRFGHEAIITEMQSGTRRVCGNGFGVLNACPRVAFREARANVVEFLVRCGAAK
jgi:hypothetical protein